MSKQRAEIDPVFTATHVAGPAVQAGQRVIQRCAVCGEKLSDNGDSILVGLFAEGQLVRAEDGYFYGTDRNFLTVKRMPRDFCIALVEA